MEVDLSDSLTQTPTKVFLRTGPLGHSPFMLVIDGAEQANVMSFGLFGNPAGTVDLVLERYDLDNPEQETTTYIEHYVGVVFDSISPE